MITEIITFNCTHGTSVESGDEIMKGGFDLTEGTCGKAVYFWFGFDDYLDYLAGAWFYNKDRRLDVTSASVIKCKISLNKNEIFDMSSYVLAREFSKFVKTMQKVLNKYAREWDDSEVRETYQLFIKEFSKKGAKYIVFRHWVPEKDYLNFPVRALGSPLCLVVKTKEKIGIENLKQENFDNSSTYLYI